MDGETTYQGPGTARERAQGLAIELLDEVRAYGVTDWGERERLVGVAASVVASTHLVGMRRVWEDELYVREVCAGAPRKIRELGRLLLCELERDEVLRYGPKPPPAEPGERLFEPRQGGGE